MRLPVVSVQSGSRPRLRRLRSARKPSAFRNRRLIAKAGCELAGVGRCSPGAGLRSALELQCSSGTVDAMRSRSMRWDDAIYTRWPTYFLYLKRVCGL